MKIRNLNLTLLTILSLVLASLTSGTSAGQASAANNCNAEDGDYIITFSKKANVQAEINAVPGPKINTNYIYTELLNGFAANLKSEQVCAFQKRPNLINIEKDQIASIQTEYLLPSPYPWNLDRIDTTVAAFDKKYIDSSTGIGVRVYIVDTGIRKNHLEFSTNRVEAGINYVGGNASDTDDCNGHGTHVAGIVGGNNYGVAKNVTLVPVRVLGCNGSGTFGAIIKGLDWIGMQSAPPGVVNMSLGGGYSKAMNDAVNNLRTKTGFFVVVAAGNDGKDGCTTTSPSSADSATVVAASGLSGGTYSYSDLSNYVDILATFSNFGNCIDFVAPGINIYSAYPSSPAKSTQSLIKMLSGTSMAAPHVSGAIARLLNSPCQEGSCQINDLSRLQSTAMLNYKPMLYIPPSL